MTARTPLDPSPLLATSSAPDPPGPRSPPPPLLLFLFRLLFFLVYLVFSLLIRGGELKCRWFHPGATRKRRRSNIAAFATIRVHGAHERRDLLLSVALSLVEIFYKVVVFLADLRWWVYLDMSTGRDRSSSWSELMEFIKGETFCSIAPSFSLYILSLDSVWSWLFGWPGLVFGAKWRFLLDDPQDGSMEKTDADWEVVGKMKQHHRSPRRHQMVRLSFNCKGKNSFSDSLLGANAAFNSRSLWNRLLRTWGSWGFSLNGTHVISNYDPVWLFLFYMEGVSDYKESW